MEIVTFKLNREYIDLIDYYVRELGLYSSRSELLRDAVRRHLEFLMKRYGPPTSTFKKKSKEKEVVKVIEVRDLD